MPIHLYLAVKARKDIFMNISTKIKHGVRYLTDKDFRWKVRSERGYYDHLSDEEYIKGKFRAIMKRELDLENPQTLNEKLQWLKLYNRDPLHTVLVDKYKVRDYIAEVLGEEYLIPSLGVWESPDDIDFDALPERFVLKCNHNSGLGMCICTDKSKLDVEKTRAELRRGINENYFIKNREWPYKDVPKRIIAEQFMVDGETNELRDYKFFCFDGKVDCVMVCIDRSIGDPKFYFFDRKWQLLRYNIRGKNAPEGFTLPKPSNMDEMFDIAEKLSKNTPFSRIDLYSVNGKTYFGEITFFPDSGFDANLLPETDKRWGDMLILPKAQGETK